MASAASSRHGSIGRPSQNNSPATSQLKPVTQLETLIVHLLSSKRSLSSIHQVQRATNILSQARSDVEESTVLAARSVFLRRSIGSQLQILRGVQFELEDVVHVSQADYNSVLKELDGAGKRLEKVVQHLKATKIEAGFRPPQLQQSESSEQGSEDVVKDCLYDFVDDGPVEELKDTLKGSIDVVQDAKADIDRTLQGFEAGLQAINDAIEAEASASASSSSSVHPLNVQSTIKELEDYAREVAISLESLVNHFDLCVTAIKHTEGGGAAVAKNLEAHDLPEGVSVNVNDFAAAEHSISKKDRAEMLAVLEKDASEVDEVVLEIHDRTTQMESQLNQLQAWREEKESEHDETLAAVKLLDQLAARLPTYITQTHEFTTHWADEKLKIQDGMTGLSDLRDVYHNFLTAYDGLIVEVARRRAVRNKMEEIARAADAKLTRLYQDDLEEREAFRTDQGEFLPMDIWPGLSDMPTRYTFSKVGEHGADSAPELPMKTVEEALKRLKAGSTLS